MSDTQPTSYMQALSNDLLEYLEKKAGSTAKDKFDAFMVSGDVKPSFRNMGDGMVVCRLQYTAQFSFEDLPTRLIDPRVIFARVTTWLLTNDPMRDRLKLSAPSMDIDAYQMGELADLDITIEFIEDVPMREAQDGDVTYKGKTWQIEPFKIYTAERGEVGLDERN